MIAIKDAGGSVIGTVAGMSYEFADAMLAARKGGAND
jgi:hypothetical protein